MPLAEFLDQVLALWEDNPDAQELVVENARGIRDATADGSYSQLLTMFSNI